MLLLTCLNILIDKVITQTIFMVLPTSGSLSHLGRPLDASSGVSPRYSSATYSQLTTFSFCRYNMMTEYIFFSQSSNRWGKDLTLLWGHLGICPLLWQFHIMSINWSELSSLTGLMALGGQREMLQWHCLSPHLCWGGGDRQQKVWTLHHMGEPSSG